MIIAVDKIAKHWGATWCRSFIRFHAFTGEKYFSSFLFEFLQYLIKYSDTLNLSFQKQTIKLFYVAIDDKFYNFLLSCGSSFNVHSNSSTFNYLLFGDHFLPLSL